MNQCQKIITNYNIKVSSNLVDCLTPDYVYIPVISHSKIFVKNKDQVNKDQIIIENKDHLIGSPISGQVVGTSLITIDNNQQVKGIIIENNFKETIKNRRPARKDISKLSKTEILELIKTFQLTENRNNQLLIKKFEKITNIKYLLINGVENEPYICNKTKILNKYDTEILDTISALAKSFDLTMTFIALKSIDTENISKYNFILGSYPEISLKLMPDLYPIADYKILEKYMANQNIPNNELLILDVEDILMIYNVLKKNRFDSEKIITVTGNAVVKPSVVKVKIGTTAVDILKQFKLNTEEVEFFADGLLKGYLIYNINNYVITDRTKGIIINIKADNHETECINCGKCNEVCPVGLNPKIKDQTNTCLKCNLCSYYCPANIKIKFRGDADEK